MRACVRTHGASVGFGLIDALHGQHVIDAGIQSHLVHQGHTRLLRPDAPTQFKMAAHLSVGVCARASYLACRSLMAGLR